jgi:ATP-dependent Clp protease adapter protein ClpS
MSQTEVQTKTKTVLELEEPSFFRVIYINDDKTSMEFVIESLVNFFADNPNPCVNCFTVSDN